MACQRACQLGVSSPLNASGFAGLAPAEGAASSVLQGHWAFNAIHLQPGTAMADQSRHALYCAMQAAQGALVIGLLYKCRNPFLSALSPAGRPADAVVHTVSINHASLCSVSSELLFAHMPCWHVQLLA